MYPFLLLRYDVEWWVNNGHIVNKDVVVIILRIEENSGNRSRNTTLTKHYYVVYSHVSNCELCCLSSRGDPQRHQQRPRSKTTESWRLKIISLELKSWRWRKRTKRERRTKVSSYCIMESIEWDGSG